MACVACLLQQSFRLHADQANTFHERPFRRQSLTPARLKANDIEVDLLTTRR
jgi:hypothetical protein